MGVIGAGHLGKYHIEKYQLMNDVDLVGFYDKNLNRSHHIAQTHKVSSFSTMEKLFDSCDAISIVTPTSTHFDVAEKAMFANCHIFIEKPISNSVNSAKKIVEISNEKKLIVQIGHIEIFNPAFCSININDINPRFI